MQNAYIPKPNKDIVGRPMSLLRHFMSRFYDVITALRMQQTCLRRNAIFTLIYTADSKTNRKADMSSHFYLVLSVPEL